MARTTLPSTSFARRYVVLGLIVLSCGHLQVKANTSVHSVQKQRLLPKGWINNQETRRRLPGKKDEKKRQEFLSAIEHQMEHEILLNKDKSSSTSSSTSKTTTVYQKDGQPYTDEMDYDRGNVFDRENGVYYDPETGTYIDPNMLIPVDNATTAVSNHTAISDSTIVTTTTTTVTTAANNDDTDGLYYDPISGTVLSSESGSVIPDSYYYYARKGNNGGSSKSSKSSKKKKKKCHKKNNHHSKKGKGKKDKKKHQKWYDECAYQTPNIHPDKVNPERCIYDYANHIRYCKRYEKTPTPTCPIPTKKPFPTVVIPPTVIVAPTFPTVPLPPTVVTPTLPKVPFAPTVIVAPTFPKVPRPPIVIVTPTIVSSLEPSGVTSTKAPSASRPSPIPAVPGIPTIASSFVPTPSTTAISTVPSTPTTAVPVLPSISVVPVISPAIRPVIRTSRPLSRSIPPVQIIPTIPGVTLQPVVVFPTLSIDPTVFAPPLVVTSVIPTATFNPTDLASSVPSIFNSQVPVVLSSTSPVPVDTSLPPAIATPTSVPTDLGSSTPSLFTSSVPASITTSPVVPVVTIPTTLLPGATASPTTPILSTSSSPSGTLVPSGVTGSPAGVTGSPTVGTVRVPTVDLSDTPSLVPTSNIVTTPGRTGKDDTVPTISPSPSSSASVFKLKSEEMMHEKTVRTEEIVRIVSEFDPWDKQDELSNIVQTGFTPYSAALLGNFLHNASVSMKFLDDLTTFERSAEGSATGTLATFYMAIDVTFAIVSTVQSDVDDFTEVNATPIVRRYFEGLMKTRLLSRLKDGGLIVKEINVLNPVTPNDTMDSNNSVAAKPDDAAASNVAQSTSNETQSTVKTEDENGIKVETKGENSTIKAAAITGCIAFVILGIVLLAANGRRMTKGKNGAAVNRRLPTSKREIYDDDDDSSSHSDDEEKSKDLSYVTDSTKNTNNVSIFLVPANQENKRKTKTRSTTTTSVVTMPSTTNPQQDDAAKERSYRSSKRFFSSIASTGTIQKENDVTQQKQRKETPSQQQHQQQLIRRINSDEDLIRFEDGPDLVANTECVRTSTNDNEHVDLLLSASTPSGDNEYQLIQPTLSTYSGWPDTADDASASTPAYSIAASSNLDEEEYKESRRKWQDCFNELETTIPIIESNETNIEDTKSDSNADGTKLDTHQGADRNVHSFPEDLFGFLEDINLTDDKTTIVSNTNKDSGEVDMDSLTGIKQDRRLSV